MSDHTTGADAGWFVGLAASDVDAAGTTRDGTVDVDAPEAIRGGTADAPADWPALAVEAEFADDEDDYYNKLREATIAAAETAVVEAERADDKQLLHAVRAMDDATRTANELAERVTEWAGSLGLEASGGSEAVAALADRDPETPLEGRVRSLASRVDDLTSEAEELRSFIERLAPEVAPNLSEMAGPVLAARLISLAGGLESLAKKPSGTVQVLGAEDALFAHLAGRGSSPKHGVIYTHPYVNGTRRDDRGSAARALAGKLSIAARIDHYSGEFRSEIHAELEERMATIRARAERENVSEEESR